MLSLKKYFFDKFLRTMYWSISKFDKEQDIIFMNYGYSNGGDLELCEKDEINRYPIQLYDFVVSHVDVQGLDILEVGSGRGGGAEYINRTRIPKSYKGVDLSKKAVDSCNKNFADDRLSFIQANAQDLPFQEGCFDAVINVESSHGYPDFGKFFDEVYRVLKAGGHFLFTDFRMTDTGITWEIDSIDQVYKKIKNSKFEIICQKTITPQVIRALDISQERRLKQIKMLTKHFFLSGPIIEYIAREEAALKGTTMYDWFESNKCEYFFLLLRK